MSDAKSPAEPSMEEILASIRRIISEDAGSGKAAPPPAAAPAPPVKSSPLDDILDLTDKVNDDGSVVSLNQNFDDFDVGGGSPRFGASNNFSFDEEEDDDGLLSNSAMSASANAFAALSKIDEPQHQPSVSVATIAGSQYELLETLIKEALKPVLKTWLDQNLPGIVEGLVKAEIQRVAKGTRGR